MTRSLQGSVRNLRGPGERFWLRRQTFLDWKQDSAICSLYNHNQVTCPFRSCAPQWYMVVLRLASQIRYNMAALGQCLVGT